jgi:hypothetical protein
MKTENRIVKNLGGALLPLLIMFASSTSALAQTASRIVFSAPVRRRQ